MRMQLNNDNLKKITCETCGEYTFISDFNNGKFEENICIFDIQNNQWYFKENFWYCLECYIYE